MRDDFLQILELGYPLAAKKLDQLSLKYKELIDEVRLDFTQIYETRKSPACFRHPPGSECHYNLELEVPFCSINC